MEKRKFNPQEEKSTPNEDEDLESLPYRNIMRDGPSEFNIFPDDDMSNERIIDQDVSSVTSSDDTVETQLIDLMTSIRDKRRPIVVESKCGFLHRKQKTFAGRYPFKVVLPEYNLIMCEKEPRVKFSNSLWFPPCRQKVNKNPKPNTRKSLLKNETIGKIKKIFTPEKKPEPKRSNRKASSLGYKKPPKTKHRDIFENITLEDLQPFQSEYTKCLQETDDRRVKPKRVEGRISKPPRKTNPNKGNPKKTTKNPLKQNMIRQEFEEIHNVSLEDIQLNGIYADNLDSIPEVQESVLSLKSSEKIGGKCLRGSTDYALDISYDAAEDTKKLRSTQTEILKPGSRNIRTISPRARRNEKPQKSSKITPNPPWKPASMNPKIPALDSAKTSRYAKTGAIPKTKPATSSSPRTNPSLLHTDNPEQGTQAVDYKIKNEVARFENRPYGIYDYGRTSQLMEFMQELKIRNTKLQDNIEQSMKVVQKRSLRNRYNFESTSNDEETEDEINEETDQINVMDSTSAAELEETKSDNNDSDSEIPTLEPATYNEEVTYDIPTDETIANQPLTKIEEEKEDDESHSQEIIETGEESQNIANTSDACLVNTPPPCAEIPEFVEETNMGDFSEEEPRPVRSVQNVLDFSRDVVEDMIGDNSGSDNYCQYIETIPRNALEETITCPLELEIQGRSLGSRFLLTTPLVNLWHLNLNRNRQMISLQGMLPNLSQMLNFLVALFRCDYSFQQRIQLDLLDAEFANVRDSATTSDGGECSQQRDVSQTGILDLYKSPNMAVQTDDYESEESASETDHVELGVSQTFIVSIQGNERRRRPKRRKLRSNNNAWTRDDWHALFLNCFYVTYFVLVYFCMTLSDYSCI